MKLFSAENGDFALIAVGEAPFGVLALGAQPTGVLAIGIIARGFVALSCGVSVGILAISCGVAVGVWAYACGGMVGMRIGGIGGGLCLQGYVVGGAWQICPDDPQRANSFWARVAFGLLLIGALIAGAWVVSFHTELSQNGEVSFGEIGGLPPPGERLPGGRRHVHDPGGHVAEPAAVGVDAAVAAAVASRVAGVGPVALGVAVVIRSR